MGRNEARGTAAVGHFFAIDGKLWARVCDLGMNAAVAYLVLACFTEKSQRFTRAGKHAIETYTSISRHRAGAALEALTAAMLITAVSDKGSRTIVLTDNPDLIWLPKAIVTGAADEVPPVERIRQAQDTKLLWLLVELYRSHHLSSDGGIHWRVIRKPYGRREIARLGERTIWGFTPEAATVFPSRARFFSDILGDYRCDKHGTGPYKRRRAAETWACCHEAELEGKQRDFWGRLTRLDRLGLVSFVGHLVEADSDEAEIIHPFDVDGSGEAIEHDLACAADAAARVLVEQYGTTFDKRASDAVIFVPLPTSLGQVQLFGLARLRYKPRTSVTVQWHAELTRQCEALIQQYREIADGSRRVLSLATSR